MMGKYLFTYSLILLVTSPFLTIGWFTIWAWFSLALILTVVYDIFCVSQENNAKLTMALYDKMDKLEQQCTRMSTIMGEVRDNTSTKTKKQFIPIKKN